MKNISKRIIAIIVAVILLFTCIPVGIFTLAGSSDAPVNHFFNFASESLYVEDSSLSKGNYSKDFGLSNGKCNITQNGTAYRYTDGDLAGLRLLSGGSIIKAGRELSVTKNTSYTIVVRMRTASNGKAFYLNIKENKDSTDNVVSMVTDTSSSKKNYYVATFNSGDKTSIFLEFEAPANGSGVIYNLAIQAEKSDFADGGFESGSINGGWVQNYPKDPVLVSGSDAKTGNYAMQVSGYSEISAYVNVEPNNDYVITGNVKVTGTYTNFQIQPMTSGMAVSSSNAISANNKYTSSSEWQKVSVPFNSGNNSLVWLRLIVDGSATAVFDDISIKKKEKVVASTESEYYNLSFAGTAEDAAPNIALFATDSGAPNISGDGKVDYSTEGALWLDARQKTQDIVTAAVVNVKKNTQYDLVVRMRSMSDTLMPTVSIYDETMQNIFSSINAVDKNKKYYTAEFTTDDSGKVSIILKMPATAAGLIYSISLIPRQENIINGNFECGDLSGWTRETSATSNLIHKGVVSANGSKVRKGYCSLELVPSSTYSTYFYANAGVTYTVNMSVKAEIDFKALLLGFNSETVGSATADKLYNQVISGDSKWQDISFEYTAEESQLVWLCLEGTSANTYIDNIYVNPKRAEIIDGSFDTTLDIWRDVINNSNSEENNYLTRPYTPVTIIPDRSYNNAGNSMYLDGTSNICETEYMITLKPNTRYLLEYYAYVENNGVKAFVFDNAEKTTDSKAYINKSMYKKSDWVRNSYTFVTDATVTTYRIVFRADGGSAYIDDIVCIELPELNVTDSLTEETNHILNFSSKGLYTPLLNDLVSNDFANPERTANVTNNGSVVYAEDGQLSGMQIKADDNAITQSATNLKVKPNTNYTLTVRMKSSKSKQLTVKAQTVDGLSNYTEFTTNVSDKKVFTSSFVTGSEEFVKILVDMQSGGTGLIYYISLIEDNDVLQNGTFESGSLNGWVQAYTKAATIETENTHSGEYAMKLSGYTEYITYLTLKENTEYELSAYVKTDSKAYIRLWSLVDGLTPSKMPKIIQKTVPSSKDYRKVVFRFNSGNDTKVWLQLVVDEGETAYFDDIAISHYSAPEIATETDHHYNFSESDLYVDTGIWNEKTSSNIFTNTEFALADGSANLSNNGVISYNPETSGIAGIRFNASSGDLKSATTLKVKPNTNYTFTVRMRATDAKKFSLKLQTLDGTKNYAELITDVSDKKVFSTSFVTGNEDIVKMVIDMENGGMGHIYYLSLTEDSCNIKNGTFESGNLNGWVHAYTKAATLETENTHSGEYAMKLSGYTEYITYLTLKENTEYELSAYVKTDTKAYIRLWSLANALTPNKMPKIVQKTATSNTEYKKIVLRFNSGNNTKVWLQLAVDEGETAYFDDISISVYNEPTLTEETNHYFSFAQSELYVDTGIWNEKTASNIFTNTDFALEDGSANISNSGVVSFYAETNGIAGIRLNATGGTDLKAATKLRVKPNTSYTVVTRMRTMTDGKALTIKLKKSDGTTDYVALTSSTDKGKYWYSAEFTTGAEEDLLLYFEVPQNSSGLVYTLSIQENTSILENGNFETGDTSGWVRDYNSDGSIVNAKTENNSTNVKNGNAALKLVGYNAYSSYINVSPNTDYFWHGWVKTNGPAYVTALEFQSGKILSMGSAKNLVKQKISASDEWQEFTLTFNTGENSIVWLNVSVEEGSCAYFDDLRAQPLYDSIVDGDFEKSVDNWKNITESTADKKGVYKIETTPVALSNKAHNGNSSLFFDGTNNMSSADYVMQVEKNTRYYVFFWGLATDFDAEICIAGLNNEFLPLKKKNINSNGEWQKYILSVDSGDNTLMSLKFLQLSGGKLYVDQLEFATSIKGATLPTAVVTETQSRLWVLKENGNNLVPNAGFESSISGTMTNFVNGKYAKRVKGENSAANGEYGLQFKTLSNEENSTILWINVNKNTDYAFSVNVKAPYLSDTNKGNITFGIVDGLLGDYLVDTQGVTCSIVPSALDNEWHTLGYEFNSGNQSKIGIMITGANSEAWFDDLMLCLKTDAEKLQWGNNNGTLSLEDSYPKNIGCAPEDNLIGCYDFEGDLSFWEDGMGYEKVFNIVDSKIDEAGKVLSFDSKDKPTHNRYIKWIEVKPDTEYTLSVMLRCDEDSLSNFSVFEKVYGGYASLIDVEAGEAEKIWKNIAFTFKTGDNDEIGLSFYDGGGSVVYNEIRLFETSKGIYMDVPTYGLISADETPEKSETNILLIALISGVSLLVVCGVLLIVFILRRK